MLTRPALALATLAALAPPCAAGAATMGTIPTDGTPVSGDLEAPPAQKWTLNLRRGEVYAVSTTSDAFGNVSVHAAGGGTIASAAMRNDEGWHGVSFRAPYAGSYVVQVACADGGCPGGYAVVAETDCPGDTSTTCSIAVGQTANALELFGEEDVDWRAMRLAAGRTYQVSVGGGPELCLAILNARGARLAATDCETAFSLAFTPPASGTYYAEVRQGGTGAPGLYSLTLR